MIDTDTIEKYILGGEWENQYPQAIEQLLAEVKRLREEKTYLWKTYLKESAEVKRLRKQLEDCKRQIQETADWMRDRGEGLHATDLDNFLEWME